MRNEKGHNCLRRKIECAFNVAYKMYYLKTTVAIPLDYAGNRNFHGHSSLVVFATTFNQRLSKCLLGFSTVAQSAID